MCRVGGGQRPTVGPVQGSLIFVVIVAVWAAYLVQHWVRRREEAAEVRSVDGFSTAMRVLQKRPMLPSAELAAPRPHSYTVTPGRTGLAGSHPGLARATVMVKRAAPVGASRPASALVARSASGVRVADDERAPLTDPLTRTDPAEVEPMPNDRTPQHPNDSGRRRPSPGLTERRLRAALLLVAVLWLPVSIVLAAMGVLTWFSVPFALITIAAVLFWLRTEAAADRVGRSDRSAGSLEPAPASSVDDTQAVATRTYAASQQADGQVAAAARAEPAPRPAAAFFDGQARETVPAAQAGQAEQTTTDDLGATAADARQGAAPGTWSPVPVPRPTYAMKAKATPRMTESGIPADVFATPEFADEAEELDERGRFARRAASG